MPAVTCFLLAPEHWVLEFNEHLTAGVGLELHIVAWGDSAAAWWLDDRGRWLRCAEVGRA
jgi:hypothetical protein